MLRRTEWQSCVVPLVWTEFAAYIIEHRVRELPRREVTSGERFAVTLFTPSHLERLGHRDWMNFESFGFPVHHYPEKGNGGQNQRTSPEVVAATAVPTEKIETIPLREVHGGDEPGRAIDVSNQVLRTKEWTSKRSNPRMRSLNWWIRYLNLV